MARFGVKIGSNKPTGWTLTKNKGWKQYEKAMNSKTFMRRLQRHKKKAFDRIAREIIRGALKTGSFSFKKNAPLTLLLKSGSQPLVDTGSKLSAVVETRTLSKDKLFIGITTANKFYARAKIIHEGGTIKVTQKMRNMFFFLWLVSKGDMSPSQLSGRAAELYALNQEWYPLKASTRAIKIPGRPFMEEIFKDKVILEKARREFIKAINDTIREQVRR